MADYTLSARGTWDGKDLENGLKNTESALSRFLKGTEKLQSFAGTVAKVTAGITAAVGGLAVGGGISRAMKIDEAQFKFKQMGLDVEATMASCNAAVQGTAYGLDAAASVAAQFGASGIQAGDGMTKALKSVAGTAAMSGRSMESIGAIFSKVAAQGRLQGDELLQLSEAGVNATAALADYMGKTQSEVRELVSAGEVDFQTFSDAMYATFGEAASGANETFSGAASNIMAALSRIGAKFADPALDGLRQVFVAAIPAIDALSTALDPLLQSFTNFVSVVTGNTVNGLNAFAEAMNNGASVLEAFKSGWDAAFGEMAGKAAVIVGVVASLTALGGALAVASKVKALVDGFKGLSIVKSIGEDFGILSKALNGSSAASSALVFKHKLLGSTVLGAAENVKSLVSNLKTSVGAHTANAAATVADTAATTANRVANSGLLAVLKTLPARILAVAAAHRVALAAALGLLAPIVLLAGYMISTGTSAEEMAQKITSGANSFAAAVPGAVNTAVAAINSFAQAVPVVMDGIVAAIESISAQLPTILGSLTGAFVSVITSLIGVLPTIITPLIQGFVTAFTSIAQALPTILPALTQALVTLVTSIVSVIPTLIPVLIQAGITLFMALVQAIPLVIPPIVAAIPQIVNAIVSALPVLIPALIQGAIQLLMAFVQAIPQIIPPLVAAIPQIISAIVNAVIQAIPQLLSGAVQLFTAIVDAVPQILGALLGAIGSLLSSAISNVGSFAGSMLSSAGNVFQQIVSAIKNKAGSIVSSVGSAISDAVAKVGSFVGQMASSGASLIGGLVDGIKGAIGGAVDAVSGALSQIRGLFPFSPAKYGPFSGRGYTTWSGKALMQDMGKSIKSNAGYVVGEAESALSKVQGALSADSMYGGSVSFVPASTPYGETSPGNTYIIGDVTVQASSLNDVDAIEDFIDMVIRAKGAK